MESHSCVSYRGYTIDVHILRNRSLTLDRQQLRFAVSWTILSSDPLVSAIVRFPEQINFLSPAAGVVYAERHAKKFIDGCISAPMET